MLCLSETTSETEVSIPSSLVFSLSPQASSFFLHITFVPFSPFSMRRDEPLLVSLLLLATDGFYLCFSGKGVEGSQSSLLQQRQVLGVTDGGSGSHRFRRKEGGEGSGSLRPLILEDLPSCPISYCIYTLLILCLLPVLFTI